MAPRAHKPNDEGRRIVGELISHGMPRATIAGILGIHVQTLEKHYHFDLATGADIANAKIAGRLFDQANSDENTMANTVARMFWLKSRARWKETSAVEHSGSDGDALGPAVSQTIVYIPDNGRDPHLFPELHPPAMKLIESKTRSNKVIASNGSPTLARSGG
jgi:hypothetical protein